MLECVARIGFRYCLEYFDIAWLTMVKNRSLEQFLKGVGWQEVLECPNSLGNSSEKCGPASQLSTSCPVDLTRFSDLLWVLVY